VSQHDPEGSAHPSSLTDGQLVARIRAGDVALFEELMRRYNQRVYRVARAIIKDETEAEDVMQQAYVNAFTHLHQFEERAKFSTWLTRIAIHEALLRRRQARPTDQMATDAEGEPMPHTHAHLPDPERQAYAAELRALLEASVDALPESYRIVFMCRDIEGLSTLETADALELGEEAVKTRLHRARAMLRRELYQRAGGSTADAYTFHRTRCDAMRQRVFAILARYR
jgi:RNA polymerase sigma-70 factor (ECF subfamily)